MTPSGRAPAGPPGGEAVVRDPVGVMTVQMMRLRHVGVRRPGRHHPGGQQVGQGEADGPGTWPRSAERHCRTLATSLADTMAMP